MSTTIASEPNMFIKNNLQNILEAKNVEKVEMFPGFWRQTLVTGNDLMLCLFTWKKGASLPSHSHVHEQAGYVISGKVSLVIDGQEYITETGCSYFVHSNQVHSATALEDSLVIDSFTPIREEYL
jgi:quercetin dioxygenase-like cupin family protein